MQKIFEITNIAPFDLMRWGSDASYDYFSQEYNKQFNLDIEILEANTKFIKNGLEIIILTYTKGK